MTMERQTILNIREWNYRRTPERRVQTVEQARAFVEQVGFCHFWPIQGVEMPNLFHAIAGRVRPVPNEHDDADISKCWSWKDDALDKKWWYYGKLLSRRATMISLDWLAPMYACSDNLGNSGHRARGWRTPFASSPAATGGGVGIGGKAEGEDSSLLHLAFFLRYGTISSPYARRN